MERCGWCRGSAAMEKYHDEEWGVPLHNDRKQFEFLMLEALQCGLSWSLMIQKRDIFRACFAGFDYEKVSAFDESDVDRILAVPDMLHSRRKVEAVISNARAFSEIVRNFGSFSAYLWDYTGGKTLVYRAHHQGAREASNGLSEEISRDLRHRGFRYLGPVTVYSHLQACGIINDHEPTCRRYSELVSEENLVFL